jgi:hypothetical protein
VSGYDILRPERPARRLRFLRCFRPRFLFAFTAADGVDFLPLMSTYATAPIAAVPPAWQKPILARLDDFQAPPRSPIVSSPATKPAT